MRKIIRLTESDLTRIVRRIIKETTMGIEPVTTNSMTVKVFFTKDGATNIDDAVITKIKSWLRPLVKSSLPTMQKFYNSKDFKLPKFITIGAGTTSKGSYAANQAVAQARIRVVTRIVTDLLEEMGINDEIIQKVITTNSDYTYNPTSVDANFFDRNKVKSMDSERFAYITVKELETKGLGTSSITGIEDALRIARGANINPNEEGIAKGICKLQTYSDIEDLDDQLNLYGGLQGFINQTITDGMTSYGSDTVERNKIKACLNSASRTSGKGDIAAIAGDKITIILK